MSENRLSFKEMCATFNVTPRTLRYYEYIELLKPDREGRSRFYTNRDQARMKLILRGRRYGFTLEEIRQWLEIYEQNGTKEQMKVLHEHAGYRLDALQAEMAELRSAIDDLQQVREEVAEWLKLQE